MSNTTEKDKIKNKKTVHQSHIGQIRHSEDRASLCILIMKANEMDYFSYLFDKILYMFRTFPLSIIRSTSHCIRAIGICHASSVGTELDTPDDGQWTCPKHVEYFIK